MPDDPFLRWVTADTEKEEENMAEVDLRYADVRYRLDVLGTKLTMAWDIARGRPFNDGRRDKKNLHVVDYIHQNEALNASRLVRFFIEGQAEQVTINKKTCFSVLGA